MESSRPSSVSDPRQKGPLHKRKTAWSTESDQLSSRIQFFDRHLPECMRVCRQRIKTKYATLYSDCQTEREEKGIGKLPEPAAGSLFSPIPYTPVFQPQNYIEEKKRKDEERRRAREQQQKSFPKAEQPRPYTPVAPSFVDRELSKSAATRPASGGRRPIEASRPTQDAAPSPREMSHTSPRPQWCPPPSVYTPPYLSPRGDSSANTATDTEVRTTVRTPGCVSRLPEPEYKEQMALMGSKKYLRNALKVYGGPKGSGFAVSRLPRTQPVSATEVDALHNPLIQLTSDASPHRKRFRCSDPKGSPLPKDDWSPLITRTPKREAFERILQDTYAKHNLDARAARSNWTKDPPLIAKASVQVPNARTGGVEDLAIPTPLSARVKTGKAPPKTELFGSPARPKSATPATAGRSPSGRVVFDANETANAGDFDASLPNNQVGTSDELGLSGGNNNVQSATPPATPAQPAVTETLPLPIETDLEDQAGSDQKEDKSVKTDPTEPAVGAV